MSRNRNEGLAGVKFFVGKSVIFRPEQDGHGDRPGLGNDFGADFLGRDKGAPILSPSGQRSRRSTENRKGPPPREGTLASSRISFADVAIILASGERGSCPGETRINLDSPMFFMARLTDPMFPAN